MSLYQYFNLSTRVEWDEPFFREGPEFKFQACFLAIKFFGKLQELFSLSVNGHNSLIKDT